MRTDGDLIQLLIYVAIGIIGVIASAYKNKMKQQQQQQQDNSNPHFPGVPGNLPSDPGRSFGPDLGPLIELFDIPKKTQEPYEYETIERGPSVEEAGMAVDTAEGSAELAGMNVDTPEDSSEKLVESDIESFEEGQSDIQKMIAKYEAIRRELDPDGLQDDIAMGEIVSVEEEAAKVMAGKVEHIFDLRKAIIYSEILKRREY
jgi:hypothetical protein